MQLHVSMRNAHGCYELQSVHTDGELGHKVIVPQVHLEWAIALWQEMVGNEDGDEVIRHDLQ